MLLIIGWGLHYSQPIANTLAATVAVLVFLLNSLPGSVDVIAVLKTRPRAYGQTIKAIAHLLSADGRSRQRIFVAGMNANSGVEAYTSLENNLNYLGFGSRHYDLISCAAIDGVVKRDDQSPFTVFREPEPKRPLPGDLIVFSSLQEHPCGTKTISIIATSNSRTYNSLAISLDQAIQLAKDRARSRHDRGVLSSPTLELIGEGSMIRQMNVANR